MLFSGQDAFGSLLKQGTAVSLSTLAFLVLFKGAAWSISLGNFRGGPTFPALFIVAVVIAYLTTRTLSATRAPAPTPLATEPSPPSAPSQARPAKDRGDAGSPCSGPRLRPTAPLSVSAPRAPSGPGRP